MPIESKDPEAFADYIDKKMLHQIQVIRDSEIWKTISSPESSQALVQAMVKYVLLEVFSYGPHVTEATFTAIGRFPKNRPDLMKPLVHHVLDEVNHCELALLDFVRLGGDEKWARSRKITPESFAMGATCRLIATRELPYAFLGYMYPFESMTPILTKEAQAHLAAKQFPTEAREFIDFHAEEDIARALRNMLIRIVGEFPEAKQAIDYGFDCFSAVYPLPI